MTPHLPLMCKTRHCSIFTYPKFSLFYLEVISKLVFHFNFSASTLQLLNTINISFSRFIISFNILCPLIYHTFPTKYCLRIFHDINFNNDGYDWNTMLTIFILQRYGIGVHAHCLCLCKYKDNSYSSDKIQIINDTPSTMILLFCFPLM